MIDEAIFTLAYAILLFAIVIRQDKVAHRRFLRRIGEQTQRRKAQIEKAPSHNRYR